MFGFRRKSKDALKDRLKLVLAYDRSSLSAGTVTRLKNDLIEVLQRYFPSENGGLELDIEERGERIVLVANIPMR